MEKLFSSSSQRQLSSYRWMQSVTSSARGTWEEPPPLSFLTNLQDTRKHVFNLQEEKKVGRVENAE